MYCKRVKKLLPVWNNNMKNILFLQKRYKMGHFFGKAVGARSFDEKRVQKGAHLGHFFFRRKMKIVAHGD